MRKQFFTGVLTVIFGIFGSVGTTQAEVLNEQLITLEKGIQTLKSDTEWNTIVIFTPDGSPMPEISYEDESERWAKWPTAHRHEEDPGDMLEMLEFREAKSEIVISVPVEKEVLVHFYSTFTEKTEKEDFFGPSVPDFVKTGKPRFIPRSEWLGTAGNSEVTPDLTLNSHKATLKQNQSARVKAKLVQAEDPELQLSDESGLFNVKNESQLPRITIHHTVTPRSKIVDPYATVRSIYYFHTFTQGWGDVGYHYLVSPEGLVFEGAKNGPTKSGTHVANRNFNNIGISLMGNFEIEEPTPIQLEVLSVLVADHAARFGIDPYQVIDYYGKQVERVAGHRDIASAQYATACPGKHLHAKLPEVRAKSVQIMKTIAKLGASRVSTRDRLSKSNAAPKIQGRAWSKNLETNKEIPLTLGEAPGTQIVSRGKKGTLEILIKNNTKTVIPAGSTLKVKNTPEGTLMTDFLAIKDIEPGASVPFRAKYLVKTTPNGLYDVALEESFLQMTNAFADNQPEFSMAFQVSGDKNFLFTSSAVQKPKEGASLSGKSLQANSFRGKPALRPVDPNEPEIKVKLKFFNERYGTFVADTPIDVFKEDGAHLLTVPKGKEVRVLPKYDENARLTVLKVIHEEAEFAVKEAHLQAYPGGVITIKNYNRGMGASRAYNQFRNRINVHVAGTEKMMVINQLPIRLYMRGLSEQPKTEPLEKKKAIHVLAQSYAYTYSQTEKRKFGTDKYDLEDDPATSQFYLGHGWEKYHSEQTEYLKITDGMVLTVDGKAVIAPYHSCSGGHTSDKWRSAYPHTKAQPLKWDENCTAAGHGVGLSGFSAHALADMGKSYEEIIHYFFNGVKIEKVY